jgi:hypothetical protein
MKKAIFYYVCWAMVDLGLWTCTAGGGYQWVKCKKGTRWIWNLLKDERAQRNTLSKN